MKRTLALVIAVFALTTSVFAIAPQNFSYFDKIVTVEGKNYHVKYVVIDGASAPTDIYLGLAKQKLFDRDAPSKIASFEGATAALTAAYHNESSGWSQYLFDSTWVVDGKPVRIYNGGSNFCVTKSGQWLFSRLHFKIHGKVKEALLPPSLKDVFISGLNQPMYSNSTTVYTSEWKDGKTPANYSSTCVIVEKGVVTSVVNGSIAIPKGSYVIVYTGSNRDRCNPKKWPKGYIKKGLHIDMTWVAEKGNMADLNKWRESKVIFGGSPTVVWDGKPYWDLKADASYNADALTYKAQRAAFGVSPGKAYMVTFVDNISIQEEGKVLLALGVKYAFNLDGGCSTFLYYDGTVKEVPCRELPCIIIAKPRK